MKIFTKKGILQKTILVILTVLCINFIVPTYSQAGIISNIGGVLANALIDLTAALGDAGASFMQWCMTGQMAAKESLLDSAIMVEQGDDRIKSAEGDPSIEVSLDDLDLGKNTDSDTYQVPVIKYTPEEIFSNKVPYLDINFINPKLTKQTSEYGVDGTAAILQKTISGWYIALRNLAIVGLLCVLVYVGIRIIISSTAAEKAKHKQMFTDWLVALCLLFFLHYIMSFTLVLIDSVNDAITGSGYSSETVTISVEGGESFSTNVMGAARFMIQSKSNLESFAYLLVYGALIAYTAIFTFHYLKRVLTMAFLTIIAPLVALTYPIDKIGDGKAQAFNTWLKEYIYTALIQPFHLIIYMIFVGSAIELVKTNFIFAIAAVAFILPAEKLLKKMFGFDKAPLGAMGAIAGYTAGSLASKFGGKGGGSSKPVKPPKTNNDSSNEDKPTYSKTHGTDGIDYKENDALNNMNNENSPEQNDEANKGEDSTTRNASEVFAEQERKNQEEEQRKQMEEQQRMQGQQSEMEEKQSEDEAQQPQNKPNGSMYGTKEANEHLARGINNVISAHGGKKAVAIKGAKTLGRAAKFTARTALGASGAILGAAAGLASNKSLSGMFVGAAAGAKLGKKAGTALGNAPGKVVGAASKIGRGVSNTLSREIDTFNGNSNLQNKQKARMFMKDSATDQYIRDKWTKEHGGIAPTDKQVKQEKESMKDYLDEGLYDVSEIYRAKKAEKAGISSKQSAKIANLAKERKIDSSVLGDDKKYDQKRKDFTQEFMDKRGMNEQEAEKMSDYVLNTMKVQVGQKYDKNAIRGLGDSTIKGNSQAKSNKGTNNKANNSNKSKKEKVERVQGEVLNPDEVQKIYGKN